MHHEPGSGYTPSNLRALIERSGLTQAAAADMIGVNHKTLRRWLVEDLDSPAHSDMPLKKWRSLIAAIQSDQSQT